MEGWFFVCLGVFVCVLFLCCVCLFLIFVVDLGGGVCIFVEG